MEHKRRQYCNRRSSNLNRRSSQEDTESQLSYGDISQRQFVKNSEMGPQSLNMEYKHYTYPWDGRKKSTLAQCICAFLNTNGGTILIGIEETDMFQRKVKGNHYNEKKIEQLKKDVTTIVQKICHTIVAKNLVKVKFCPVSNGSSNRPIKSMYVVQITVEKGWLRNCRELYNVNDHYYFRTENEVKFYNSKVELNKIKTWRQQLEREQAIREFRTRQQIKLLTLIQKTNLLKKPELKEESTQTDSIKFNEEKEQRENERSSIKGLKVSLLANQAPQKQDKKTCVDFFANLLKKLMNLIA